jgi:alcohol dehydrogenase (NADP+)
MIKANARGTYSPTEKFKEINIERRDLEPKDILIDIKYCGICHSDIHTARSEW